MIGNDFAPKIKEILNNRLTLVNFTSCKELKNC
jgi:hypothetical protein